MNPTSGTSAIERETRLLMSNDKTLTMVESQLQILETLFQNSPIGYCYVDQDIRYVRVNEALAAMKGISVAEHIGKYVKDVIPGIWPNVEPLYRRAFGGETILNYEVSGIADASSQQFRHWLASLYPVSLKGQITGVGVIVYDLTPRVMAERQLQVRTNLYAMLSRVNRAVALYSSKDELFREICAIAIEVGQFRFAWIGEPDHEQMKMVASAGVDNGYMSNLVISMDQTDPRSQGPTGRTLSTGQSFVVNDFAASSMTTPWHEKAHDAGFAASATFPLKENGCVVAVLTLYAAQVGFFTDELISTIEEFVPIISGALDRYAQAQERDRLWKLAMDPMCVAGFDGFFKQLNPAWIELLGRCESELLSRRFIEFVHPDDRDETEIAFSQLLKGKAIIGFENRYERRDGSYCWLSWSAFPQIETKTVFGIARNVTDRKQFDTALREKERQLSSLIQNLDVGVLLQDQNDRVLFANSKAKRILGFHRDSLEGSSSNDFEPHLIREDGSPFPPDATPSVIVARTKEPISNVIVGIRSDEHVPPTWLQVSATPRLNYDGTLLDVLVTIVDISERKHIEAELRIRDNAMQAVSQGIIITDPRLPDNPIIYASPSIERLTGYTPGEITGKNCRLLQGPETNEEVVTEIREQISKGRGCSVELLNYRKDGSKFWNSLTISPVFDGNNQVSHFVGVQTDVTERRLLEDQMRQAQKMEAIGQLAGGVSHDFNNFLTVIYGQCDVLLSSIASNDPLRESLLEIVDAAERAKTLTSQLLTFSRQQVLDFKVLNLNTVVHDTEKMLRRLIGEDVSLTTRLQPNIWPVKVDAGQILQILMNLAVNSRDAMPQGGQLVIETRNIVLDDSFCLSIVDLDAGHYVRLSVADTGIGMDEITVARIFEPFFTTKGVGHGTGLGLPTVHGIVKQSNGHISVESEVGKGTTIHVYLPRSTEPESANETRSAAASIPPGVETVLLVEDEKQVRKLTHEILQRCGYKVLEAENGLEAVRLSQTFPGEIHLLISDVVMPHLGGRALAEQIQRQRPDCKVLFVSGYADDDVLRHGVLEAEFAFLAKPFTPSSLARKVRSVLSQH